MNKLEAIKKKCIEANPDIFIEGCQSSEKDCQCWWHITYPPDGNKYRDTRLADVLLAIGKTWKASDLQEKQYEMSGKRYELIDSWNLRTDSLDQQSPETIDFLYQLLCE